MTDLSIEQIQNYLEAHLSLPRTSDQCLIMLLEGSYSSSQVFYKLYPLSLRNIPGSWQATMKEKLRVLTPIEQSIFFEGLLKSKKDNYSPSPLPNASEYTYLDDEINWQSCFNGPTANLATLFLSRKRKQYFVFPLHFLSIHIGWIIYQDEFAQPQQFQIPMQSLLLLQFSRGLLNILHKSSSISGLSELAIMDWFTAEISHYILPVERKINKDSWTPVFSNQGNTNTNLVVKFGKQNTLYLKFSLANIPSNKEVIDNESLKKKLIHLHKEQLQSCLEKCYDSIWLLWKKSQDMEQITSQADIKELLLELESFDLKLQLLHDRQRKITENLRTKNLKTRHASDYEFYRISTGWIVIWQGQLVNVKGNPDKGLSYIHRLLRTPGDYISAYELDDNIKPSSKSTEFTLMDGLSVRLSTQKFENKRGIANAIIRLQEESMIRENFSSDELYLQEKILHQANLCYYASELVKLETTSSYVKQYQEIRQELLNLIADYRGFIGEENPLLKHVLTQARLITKPADDQRQVHQIRDRVSTAIRNAIKRMDSNSIQSYFSDTLELGIRSRFNPSLSHSIDWNLYYQSSP